DYTSLGTVADALEAAIGYDQNGELSVEERQRRTPILGAIKDVVDTLRDPEASDADKLRGIGNTFSRRARELEALYGVATGRRMYADLMAVANGSLPQTASLSPEQRLQLFSQLLLSKGAQKIGRQQRPAAMQMRERGGNNRGNSNAGLKYHPAPKGGLEA